MFINQQEFSVWGPSAGREKESTCGPGLLSENMQVASPCCSEEQISYSTGMSAPSFQFQWHLAGFNMLMLRPSSLRGSKPFTCSLVLPCSCLDSLGSLFLVREFPGHLVLDAHVCSKVPFLVRQAFRSYLKLLCVSGWCGQAPGLLLCHRRLKWVWTRPSPGPAWALWSVPLLKGTSRVQALLSRGHCPSPNSLLFLRRASLPPLP